MLQLYMCFQTEVNNKQRRWHYRFPRLCDTLVSQTLGRPCRFQQGRTFSPATRTAGGISDKVAFHKIV